MKNGIECRDQWKIFALYNFIFLLFSCVVLCHVWIGFVGQIFLCVLLYVFIRSRHVCYIIGSICYTVLYNIHVHNTSISLACLRDIIGVRSEWESLWKGNVREWGRNWHGQYKLGLCSLSAFTVCLILCTSTCSVPMWFFPKVDFDLLLMCFIFLLCVSFFCTFGCGFSSYKLCTSSEGSLLKVLGQKRTVVCVWHYYFIVTIIDYSNIFTFTFVMDVMTYLDKLLWKLLESFDFFKY